MSAAAGAAVKAVLAELGQSARRHRVALAQESWESLHKLLDVEGGADADGAAAAHPAAAREEAARMLLGNHENVLDDVTNPLNDKNIIGVPLTQRELTRVSADHVHYVDQAMREVVRRLLGRRAGSEELQEHLDGSTHAQAVAW
eukprot:945729-Prymnesium_polylepis.1